MPPVNIPLPYITVTVPSMTTVTSTNIWNSLYYSNATTTTTATTINSVIYPQLLWYPADPTNVWYYPDPSVLGNEHMPLIPGTQLDYHRVRPSPPAPAERQRQLNIIRADRRVLRRSMDLFRSLRPPEELEAFLRGQEIVVQGARYEYRLKKRLALVGGGLNHGHTPYTLTARRPDSTVVHSGCVVLQNTPILDQVLAVLLHLGDPDAEDHFLRTTNWTPALSSLTSRVGDLLRTTRPTAYRDRVAA
jgi:hypothetical protein